jgi:drug/metabolite transporter (DMT)-like permease
VTSYVLLPLALMQLRNMPSSDRRRLLATSAVDMQHIHTPSHPSSSVSALPLLIVVASGACLAVSLPHKLPWSRRMSGHITSPRVNRGFRHVHSSCLRVCMWRQVHFGGWVWGIEHTSLPHSLLFVSFTPVLLSCGAAALGHPTSLGEVLGTALGVGGSVLLLMDVPRDDGGDGGVSLAGDAASLLASLAFIGYITAGMLYQYQMYPCSVGGGAGLCVFVDIRADFRQLLRARRYPVFSVQFGQRSNGREGRQRMH